MKKLQLQKETYLDPACVIEFLPLNKKLHKLFTVFLICQFLLAGSTQIIASETTAETAAYSTDAMSATLSGMIMPISGTVSDTDGTPLIGVTVQIKGTAQGTITDFDGRYSFDDVAEDAVLVFSFIGMETIESPVSSSGSVNIVMEEASIGLNEVVVVGYTTRKKGEVTGSVSTVSAEVIERTTNKDVAKSLSGRVPGLIVADRGGYPGSTDDITLLIRGKSTLNNNAPLVLIDGIPTGSFSHLAPQDIESLSVLKDGAAAIYGARAANGVILITTKRGRVGKTQVNLTSAYSLSSFSSNPRLMNSEQFTLYENEVADRNGIDLPYTQEQISNYAAGNDPINFPSTDWADLTFANNSPELRTSISMTGGSEKASYFVSGDHIDQQGLFASGDLNFEQYQLRSNIDIRVLDNLSIGVDVAGRFGDRQQPGVDAGFIYKHIYTNFPTEVGIYPNGLYGFGGENGANPGIMSSSESGFLNTKNNTLTTKLSFDLSLDELTEGLSVKGYTGIRRINTDTKSWYTPWDVYTFQQGTNEYIRQPGFSQRGNKNILRETFFNFNEVMFNVTAQYNRTMDQHTFRGLLGHERFTSNQRNFFAERRDFPSDNHPELFAGSDEGQLSNGTSSEFGRLNYFGSLSYDFDKKYFVDLTLRHDGSSNFGPGNQYGTFPGLALAWSIGNEGFMSGTSGWLNALKLRASWAQMGNDRIPPFQFLTRYNFGGPTNAPQPNYYIFGLNGTRFNGYNPANVPNPDITWEKADMKNLGLSFSLFDYKLTGDINYFLQKRTDILIRRSASIPDAAGITLPQENLGKVDNFGWELQLGWNDKIGDISYNIGANFTQAKNEVVFLDEAVNVPDQLKREGFPIDSYIVYPTAGIFRDQAQVESTAAKLDGTVEGEPVYLDTNGDGAIDAADRIRIYSSNVPEIQYGITGGISVKNFDVNLLLQGQANAETLVFFDQSGAKPSHVFEQRWTPENRDARYPRAFAQGDPFSGNQNTAENFQGADLWLHDASFLRLKEIEVGYTLSKDVIKFGDVRVFFRGLNLLTMFSEIYDLGLDPEANAYNNFRNSTYPSLKSYSFGFNLNFN